MDPAKSLRILAPAVVSKLNENVPQMSLTVEDFVTAVDESVSSLKMEVDQQQQVDKEEEVDPDELVQVEGQDFDQDEGIVDDDDDGEGGEECEVTMNSKEGNITIKIRVRYGRGPKATAHPFLGGNLNQLLKPSKWWPL